MRRTVFSIAVAFCLLINSPARADITVDVIASPAPNFFGSPSWNAYLANALNSLENGLGEIGDRETDPTAYEIFADGAAVLPNELIVSSFPSWRGVADPSSPFDNERGNRLHFGIHVVGDGTMRFRLEDLSYEITSDDGNVLGIVGDFSGLTYSSTRVGIDYGADMSKGGGDDTIITTGAATQFVDELIYVGVGVAYDASSAAGATNQDKLDNTFSAIASNADFLVTGSYVLTDDTGANILASGSTSLIVVPEPGGALLLISLAGVAGFMRRRK